jgi:penicillin-insensitive murein DD-endopeptidase
VVSLEPVRPVSIAITALASTLTLSATTLPGTRSAGRGTTARASLGGAALRFGRSIGSPTEGRLAGGMHLDETAYLRIVPADTAGDVRWGLEPLVMMLDRAARSVRRQYPESVMSVGHLSREGGGEIDQHRSHESGRDADVGFFVRTSGGRQLLAARFVAFRGDASAQAWPGAVFDDAKNWALVSALLTDPQAHVTHVFVASPLRARLLSYAERAGVPLSLRVRAAETMQQPHGALPHDDHFHVRIGCPGKMSGCVENPIVRAHPMLPPHEHGGVGRRGPRTAVAATSPATSPVSPAPAKPAADPPATASMTARVAASGAPSTPSGAAPATPALETLPALDSPSGPSPSPPAAAMAAPLDDLDE